MVRRATAGRTALTAVACVLAAAAAGCGKEGELVKRGAAPPPPATTQTQPRPATTQTQPRPPTATAPAAAATTPSSSQATAADDTRVRNTAARYARARFGVSTLARDVTLRRSRRAPSWVMASAADGPTLWAVWLRNGAVALATTDPRRFDPPSVPCDARPAFLAPKC